MPRNMGTVRMAGKDGRNQPNGAGLGMGGGLVIGMSICVTVGIALSELGGYHDVIPYSIIFGSAVGLLLGSILERRHQKRNREKAKRTGV